MPDIIIRPMDHGEIPAVCQMVLRVFYEFVEPFYNGEASFKACVNPPAMDSRLRNHHFVLVAVLEKRITGQLWHSFYSHGLSTSTTLNCRVSLWNRGFMPFNKTIRS